MLTIAGCRTRQKRLLALMDQNGWDLFLTGNHRTAYYLSGSLAGAEIPVAFAMTSSGRSALVTSQTGDAAADDLIPLETYSIQRSITRPWHDAAALLKTWMQDLQGVSTVAVELAATPLVLQAAIPSTSRTQDASEALLRLRKRKDPDEIDEIRHSLHLCEVAYRAAKTVLEPDRTEIDVHNAMYSAVTAAAGTSVTLAGDFASGTRAIRGGGPPTPRVIGNGDLFILDLFPAPRLYFGDTCRTFCAGVPSEQQVAAWDTVRRAIELAERLVRPGVRARDVYSAVKDFLDRDELTRASFWHHAGHGVGHHGHEAPRLIPGTDDMIEEDDVIAIEPALYSEALQGGIRLENTYVVRTDGLENLFNFPLELV